MKIMFLSDSPFIPTGYRNQAIQLAKFLKDQGHEIHYLGNAYNGTTIDYARLPDGTVFDWKIYGEMTHTYFQSSMSKHLKEQKIDRFVILLDTFMLHPWFMNVDTAPAKTFFWFPSDGGGGMPKGCELILKKIDHPVAMARYGQKQVKDYYNIDVSHIPHGTDPKRHFKLDDKKRLELRQKYGLRPDAFVVGVVARNQPRKNLDRTFKTFFLLKDKVPNAVLFLHLDPDDPAQPMFHVRSLIQRYNLENRVVFSGMKAHAGFDWNQMNEVYNVMDCFFLSTSGEGFGIPIIEAMAAEVPVAATNYTTTQELVIDNKAGVGIALAGTPEMDFYKMDAKDYDARVLDGTMTGSWEVERGMCSIQDAAAKIEYLYKNSELRKQMGENGRKAVIEKYDFDKVVGPAWVEILK